MLRPVRRCGQALRWRSHPLRLRCRHPGRPVPVFLDLFHQSRAIAAAHDGDSKQQQLDFGDGQTVFKPKTTFDLFRHWGIYKICAISFVVRYCDKLYAMGLKVVGPRITHFFLRHSMFAHFCAGEDVETIRPRVDFLQSHGIGGILDYAAEAKEEEEDDQGKSLKAPTGVITARKYEYVTEAKCNANTEIFLQAVRAVKNVTPNGFAAIKLTGLGNPVLLERMSACIVQMTQLFWKLGSDGHRRRLAVEKGGPVNADDLLRGPQQYYNLKATEFTLDFETFKTGWQSMFVVRDESELRKTFDALDIDGDGTITYIDFMNSLKLSEINNLVQSCISQGPLFKAALDEEEVALYLKLVERAETVMDEAAKLGVRVMVDAEWTDIQPAIDHIVLFLTRKYNRGDAPIVFQTYQTYLKGMHDCVKLDLDRSQREGWRFGAKVVRGAYMVSERAKAKSRGVESPVCDSYAATEENYHNCIDSILRHGSDASGECASAPPAEVLIASHSRVSIEYTLSRMREFGTDKENVYFGQLLGMADHLTFTLGAHGYKAYKYVPYGPIDEVVPYLIRRTQENSTVLGSPGVLEERAMVATELGRRMRPF